MILTNYAIEVGAISNRRSETSEFPATMKCTKAKCCLNAPHPAAERDLQSN